MNITDMDGIITKNQFISMQKLHDGHGRICVQTRKKLEEYFSIISADFIMKRLSEMENPRKNPYLNEYGHPKLFEELTFDEFKEIANEYFCT